MGEYITDQTTATTSANGDYFVFDTATGTFKISRANLIGQMDTNAAAISTNAAAISTNAAAISTNAAAISGLQNLGLELMTIDILSLEILDLNTAPTLLVPLNSSQYIDIIDLSVSYKFLTTAYASGGDLLIQTSGITLATISDTIYTQSGDTYGKSTPSPPVVISTFGDIMLTTSSNPTLGDGELTINILYRRN